MVDWVADLNWRSFARGESGQLHMSCRWPWNLHTEATKLLRDLSVKNNHAPSIKLWFFVELFRAGALFSGDSNFSRSRAKEPK
jgi:hypothetical protein